MPRLSSSVPRTMAALRGAALVLLVGAGFASIVASGTGGGRARTPPTFALAWVDPSLSVRTAESRAAVTFINDRVIPTASGQYGPAIGHDGNLTWLAVWATVSGFNFNTGIGGIPSGGTPGGITWSTTIERGIVRGSPAGSPSVAFGGGRWVIAYRNAGNRIEVIRSGPNSLGAWEPPRVVTPPLTTVISSNDPSIAYGNGRFVLVYRTEYNDTQVPLAQNSIVAVQSVDGVNWSDRSVIGATEGYAPGLTFGAGKFIAILTRLPPALSGMRFIAHLSDDGQSWTGAAGEGGNFDPITSFSRPGVAYGQGQLVVVQGEGTLRSWTGTPNNPASPSSFTFLPVPPLGSVVVPAAQGRSASIAFGGTP